MNILVVFLLVVLGCSPAEGVSKCELRDMVLQQFQRLQEEEKLALDPKDATTKIVCHAEKSSNFITSAVNTQGSGGGSSSNRKKRSMESAMLEMSESHDSSSSSNSGSSSSEVQPQNAVNTAQDWTFYGIFQLGNLLVCTDEVSKNPDICHEDCSALTDSDVTNDIQCVMEIIKKLLNDGFDQNSRFMQMVKRIYDRECDGYVYQEYFKECN